LKFKSVFILFNAAVGVSFLFVFAMPFIALGGSYAAVFWRSNWPLALALVAVLSLIDAFFILNWRLFSLLEREDWPALSHYLEGRVVGKGRYDPRLVRLLANTYLVLSDAASVVELEKKVAAAKPRLLSSNALVFGVARVLLNKSDDTIAFFAERRKSPGRDSAEWVEWYYAFALLLGKRFDEAAEVLIPLSASAKDAVVAALCAFFLEDTLSRAVSARSADCLAAATAAASRVKAKLPNRAAWEKELAKARADIHVVVLTKSLEEAGERLYA
jgi:hypothetical protein